MRDQPGVRMSSFFLDSFAQVLQEALLQYATGWERLWLWAREPASSLLGQHTNGAILLLFHVLFVSFHCSLTTPGNADNILTDSAMPTREPFCYTLDSAFPATGRAGDILSLLVLPTKAVHRACDQPIATLPNNRDTTLALGGSSRTEEIPLPM